MIHHKFAIYLSPAKLNLGLKVIGKQADGYHTLKTVFCLIDLFDEISIQITDNGKISLVEHNQAWSYKTDLAYLAAIKLQDIYLASKIADINHHNFGANIKIKKTIPAGSGLGGGSSNAATTLIVLNKLWNINLSKDRLIEIGQTLGADVPFFIYGQNALATGVGEILTPIEIPLQYFVIVKPSFHIPTKNIFANLNFGGGNIEQEITLEYLLDTRENDLFPVALKYYPQLKDIVNTLEQYGKVSMTGSGSAMYLSFSDKKVAKKVAKLLENSYNTYLVESLNESPIF